MYQTKKGKIWAKCQLPSLYDFKHIFGSVNELITVEFLDWVFLWTGSFKNEGGKTLC